MKDIKPKFRPDIITHAHDERHGARSIVLEDPVANKYFRISTYEFELLSIFDGTMTVGEALEKLKLRGRYFAETHASRLLEQFSRSGLLLGTGYGTSKVQTAFRNKMDSELRKRSLFKLYYLYIPLISPDKFLEKTLPIWRGLVNRITAILFSLFVPGALYLLVLGLPRMWNEFLFFFTLENLIMLWIAIAVVKLVHEFAHAYTAKSFGLRVPEMGVALLILFPCLYCNTTAAWQLADRKQRIAISLAGILSEVVIATISIYVWYFSKAGLVNSVAFYLAAVSLISSVLFNGNPLLKFDGYFVLTDLLRIPNLQSKSFGFIRYLFLNQALGIESVKRAYASLRDQIIFVVYGVSSLVYRVFLYTGIISRIYYKFDKSIGVIMGFIAFSLFVVRPLTTATRNLIARRPEMNFRPKGLTVLALIAVMVIFLLTRPWAGHSVYPCYFDSAMLRDIAMPAEAPVSEVMVRQGDVVATGQVLFKLDPTPLQYRLKEKESGLMLIKKEMEIIQASEKDLPKLQLKYIELSQAADAIQQIKHDLENCEWKAPFGGAVARLSPELQPGARLEKGAVVGELAGEDQGEIVGLIPELDVGMVQPGQKVEAWFPIDNGVSLALAVKEVIPFKAEDLEASPFSSRFGGEIATEAKPEIKREAGRDLATKDAPLEPCYVCKIDFPNKEKLPLGLTGRLVVKQPPRSALTRIIDAAYHTFHREIIF
jgi:putative peptide zinc metalloprotease protein